MFYIVSITVTTYSKPRQVNDGFGDLDLGI